MFLRAAELLSGPWRDTLNAATMLGQSKTAHQAEIDAACESIDFFRFNVEFMTRHLRRAARLRRPGIWNRLEYRPLEGFVFAVSPFNFTAIGGNLTSSPALMGNSSSGSPPSTAMLSAYYLMRLFQEAGLPDGVINLVYGSGADDRRRGAREPATSPASTSPARPRSSTACGAPSPANMEQLPQLPADRRRDGRQGLHRRPPVRRRRRARDRDRARLVRVPGPEVLGGVARLRAVEPLARAAGAPAGGGRDDQGRRRLRLPQLHGRRHRRRRRSRRRRPRSRRPSRAPTTDIVVGGGYDDSHGYFVDPTVIETRDPNFRLMREEIFGPVVTTYVYDEKRWAETLDLVDSTAPYGLTGAVFSEDRAALDEAAVGAALRGRELLRQRQADRRRRRPAAVRRRPRLGDERQGRLDVEPDPLGLAAHDQGDVHAAARLPLSVPRVARSYLKVTVKTRATAVPDVAVRA